MGKPISAARFGRDLTLVQWLRALAAERSKVDGAHEDAVNLYRCAGWLKKADAAGVACPNFDGVLTLMQRVDIEQYDYAFQQLAEGAQSQEVPVSDEHVIYTDGHREVRRMADIPHSKGGAPTLYELRPLVGKGCGGAPGTRPQLPFQHDTIEAVGPQGWTNEAILAVLKDRLGWFQAGPFPCQENEDALNAVKIALARLEQRTADRKARGVEGKHEA